jgi:mannose-6-phosphate isomerase-like protein (cupin superfamily)
MAFIDPSELPEVEPKSGWHGRFFHSEHMTFGYYQLDAGAALHLHSHANEEVWHILEGDVDFTLGDETRLVGAGRAVTVPAGTPHAVAVKQACRAIVVDHPVRHELGGVRI